MSITTILEHARRHPRDAAAAIVIGSVIGLWLGSTLDGLMG